MELQSANQSRLGVHLNELASISFVSRKPLSSLFTAFVLLLVSVSQNSVTAQNSVVPPGNAPGSPAGSYLLSKAETLSLYSGRVHVAVPLVTVGGRGNAGFTMVWRIDDASWSTHREYNNGYTGIYADVNH